ncbi:hypothetical protein GNI_153530 [Gregarina niphandrodes]|uniref:Uncharacterized protein n=1 Tax=Gregarina niphandrodes TaxID=110365 RepID=A0A023AZR8_GRENI|nr:hypothetical protein GNI_153530 [Gregarina niphandrodes]EZG44030.1 hypothetical protein GNI_153530 [Gregarina niphandrodes]|eukprot:XP_011132836.1 hypothetical protein GNI_153530 [Gregarina niphandrodes]
MHALKCEASSLTGSELLSVLIRPDGSQTKLDDCVAQVVTIQAGGAGEVTALVLAPKTAFEVDLETVGERTPLTLETTMVEGEIYDWFEKWDRMMVWRPKEGPPGNERAEAALLLALRRRLERTGPRDKPEAVDALCREIFGERLHDVHGILNGSRGVPRPDEADEVSVTVTRPIDPSELEELLAQVPENWMPVLQRSAEWKTANWNDTEDRMDAAPAEPSCVTKRCLYTTAGVLGLGSVVGVIARSIWPGSTALSQGGAAGEDLPGTYEPLSDNRAAVVWAVGDPVPAAPCGSGTLLCDGGCSNFGSGPWPIAFGNPWPFSFPVAWKIAHAAAPAKCEVRCSTREETRSSFSTRLLTQFPLQTPNTTMSLQERLQQISAALSQGCAGSDTPWQNASTLTDCVCDMASVSCPVIVKPSGNKLVSVMMHQQVHGVTLVDFEASIARLAGSFADYTDDTYSISPCSYTCWNLSPQAKQTIEANKAAEAARQATSTTSKPTTTTKRTTATPRRRQTTRDRPEWDERDMMDFFLPHPWPPRKMD